jgi:FkbM family methyltransferase
MYILELLSYLPLSSALRVRAAVRNQDGKLIQIKPKGHKPIFLRRCAADIDVIGEIVRDDVYGTAFSLLKLCRTAVDLGANIGVTSLVLLERFPSCRVIAFEPHRGNFEVLRRNLPNCETYEAAVWSKAGAVTLEGPSDGFDRFQAHEGGPIKAYSMRDVLVLAGRPIDFLKMDIEGSEIELFKDPSWLGVVNLLAIEFHGNSRELCNFDRAIAAYGLQIAHTSKHTTVAIREAPLT